LLDLPAITDRTPHAERIGKLARRSRRWLTIPFDRRALQAPDPDPLRVQQKAKSDTSPSARTLSARFATAQ